MAAAEHHTHAVNRTRDAVRDDVVDLGVVRLFIVIKSPLFCRMHHGASHRMREVFFQAGRKAQHFVFGESGFEAHHTRELGSAFRESARLVKDDRVGFGKRF